MNPIQEEERDDLILKIWPDYDCPDPVRDADIAGTIATYNKSGRLIFSTAPHAPLIFEECRAWLSDPINRHSIVYAFELQPLSWNRIKTPREIRDIDPPYDGGGFYWMTPAQKRGEGWRLSTRNADAEACMLATLQVWKQWFDGECYGYTIETQEGDEIAACWGFIGLDYCLSEARAQCDFWKQEAIKTEKLYHL